MKKFVLVVLLSQTMALCATEKSKPNPADYPLTVHVVGSQGSGNSQFQHLDVVLQGKQVELLGMSRGVLALGDYHAKVTKGVNPPKTSNGYDMFEAYEFLFPDGTTRYYEVIGYGSPDTPLMQSAKP